ncbi:ATP-binding cassette domain-containing protein [Vagococcus hydrophili]|uniref:ATP-binding cassette domain-containing protein n=1 Tax=Vagococcus hydrophili TaxID=2714947 RepID=A0A6G8ATE4_9ENTE|nr:ATP-binding cassette domain-containing protein [Vagococcus hydrophili]QIL48266.1 ATP-binding cassette domain-containing protein [Vagococcus hydrophili]
MIKLEKVNISIKNEPILKDVNLNLENGRCYGFVGRNGSGKSVLFKAISGLLKIESGMISIDGVEINPKNPLKDVGVIIESPMFIASLSGFDNLKCLAGITKKISDEEINSCLEKVGLEEANKKKFKNYSLGMKQRLRIAQAIMEDPTIYILDEPFNGLDEKGVQDVHEIILDLKARKKMILLTSHDDRDIEKLNDYIFKIENRSVVNV